MVNFRNISYFFLMSILSGCASVRHIPHQELHSPYIKPSYQQALPRLSPLIMIDAGHGGKDLGAESDTNPKYQEKNLNLTTARFLEDYLLKMGYRTSMTREEDVFIPLKKRAEIANQLNGDLFVSIHYNSAANKKAEGIEVFYYQEEEDSIRTKKSKEIAESIMHQLIENTKAKSRGAKHGNYLVIRETKKTPAVLVEGGFISNEKELQKLKNGEYLKKIAWSIAKGIDQKMR